jgi:hypothetical protein
MVIRRWLSWLRPVAAALGLVAFVGGVVALFTIDNSAGSLFLITLGVVLVLVVFLGGRIQLESFEILGAKIKVREVDVGEDHGALCGDLGSCLAVCASSRREMWMNRRGASTTETRCAGPAYRSRRRTQAVPRRQQRGRGRVLVK